MLRHGKLAASGEWKLPWAWCAHCHRYLPPHKLVSWCRHYCKKHNGMIASSMLLCDTCPRPPVDCDTCTVTEDGEPAGQGRLFQVEVVV